MIPETNNNIIQSNWNFNGKNLLVEIDLLTGGVRSLVLQLAVHWNEITFAPPRSKSDYWQSDHFDSLHMKKSSEKGHEKLCGLSDQIRLFIVTKTCHLDVQWKTKHSSMLSHPITCKNNPDLVGCGTWSFHFTLITPLVHQIILVFSATDWKFGRLRIIFGGVKIRSTFHQWRIEKEFLFFLNTRPNDLCFTIGLPQ